MNIELGAKIGMGRTAEVFALGSDKIVKLFHADYPDSYGEAEARIAALVSASPLPVPAFFDCLRIDGRIGLVYERLTGRTMLEENLRRPYRYARFANLFADIQRQLHDCELPGLSSFRDELTNRIGDAPGLTDREKAKLTDHMAGLPRGRQVVCHGDFHPDNVFMTPRGPVVIDWLTAASGDAAADLARTQLLLSIGKPEGIGALAWTAISMIRARFLKHYRRRYLEFGSVAQADIDAWLPIIAAARLSEGIESESEFLLDLASLS